MNVRSAMLSVIEFVRTMQLTERLIFARRGGNPQRGEVHVWEQSIHVGKKYL